ncbi:hypothetical protein ES708_15577 [subsurface metagenome]
MEVKSITHTKNKLDKNGGKDFFELKEMEMNLYNYERSKEISAEEPSFAILIMAICKG